MTKRHTTTSHPAKPSPVATKCAAEPPKPRRVYDSDESLNYMVEATDELMSADEGQAMLRAYTKNGFDETPGHIEAQLESLAFVIEDGIASPHLRSFIAGSLRLNAMALSLHDRFKIIESNARHTLFHRALNGYIPESEVAESLAEYERQCAMALKGGT